MIKLKEIVNESLQLPNGTEIQVGKVFTGQGKAFVKEEDLNEEVVSLSKSDIKKMERASQKLIKDLESFLKVWKKKHKVSVSDPVLYDTSKEWEGIIRNLKIKFGGWFHHKSHSSQKKIWHHLKNALLMQNQLQRIPELLSPT